jgi:hypothetical protein
MTDVASNMHQAIRDTVRMHSGLFLAQGVVTHRARHRGIGLAADFEHCH